MKLLVDIPLNLFTYCGKRFSSNTSRNDRVLELLKQRTLLKITGRDTVDVLQNLVTNDVQALTKNGVGSLYAMFLNTKGHVMFDTIIYKIPESDSYILEVDRAAKTSIEIHLNNYRVGKEIKIENADKEYSLWVHFNPQLLLADPRGKIDKLLMDTTSASLGTDSAIVLQTPEGKIMEFFDPRTPLLGSRIIAHKRTKDIVYENYKRKIKTGPTQMYKMYRYYLGIAEGILELPSGRTCPLDANCDYLNGLSFNKGFFLGKELIAKSYVKSTTKRCMPMYFYDKNYNQIKDGTVKARGKNVGILRGREFNLGLASLKIREVADQTLVVDGVKGFTVRPVWWPEEDPSEERSMG